MAALCFSTLKGQVLPRDEIPAPLCPVSVLPHNGVTHFTAPAFTSAQRPSGPYHCLIFIPYVTYPINHFLLDSLLLPQIQHVPSPFPFQATYGTQPVINPVFPLSLTPFQLSPVQPKP